MIRHLNENAWAVQTTPVPGADQAAARFSLPEGIRDVIGKRLSRLSEPTNELLQIAAVIGRSFDLSAPRGSDRPGRAPSSCRSSSRLCVPGSSPRSRESSIGLSSRMRSSKRRCAPKCRPACACVFIAASPKVSSTSAGTRLDEHLGALAFHYGEAASSGCVDEAVIYACRAARHAMQALAFEDAVVYLERALTIAGLREEPDAAERRDIAARPGTGLLLARATKREAVRPRTRASTLPAPPVARRARTSRQAAILLWVLRTYSGGQDAATGEVPLVREALDAIR